MRNTKTKLLHRDDVRLVKELRRGEEQAFRRFFDEFYDRLYRFALPRVSCDPCDAEDMVQQTMTKALRAMKTYRGEAQLQTWLFSICRNTIIDFRRKKGLHDEAIVRAEDFPGVRAAVDSYKAPACNEPAVCAQQSDQERLVQIALDRLPKHYGDALEWKYIQGWTIKEIGSHLGLGKEATQSMLARAKRSFADVYLSLTDDAVVPG